ncbi:molecular chaperone [Pseudomonas sp. SWRI153]|uniref:Molecular chaperone n=1 Tax=Pseudomonas khorasanensis TaxID=2745508 RepID=A0A923EZS8_9PSED|nr:molecular chaperone [Pseudomonas khorasanensis]MBV4484733.1 molecular chaperone [Pseudomonas khorasanensis]
MRLKVAALSALAACLWLSQVQAGVNVGTTRVIYEGKEKEANLSMANTDDDSPYLIQSWVSPYDKRDTSADEFIITPPLFRLDAKSQNILRIIATNAQNLPKDKESLFFVNVKAIPAVSEKQKNQNVLQIALKTTIKLFYRPAELKGSLKETVQNLEWRVDGGKLSVHNPSAFNVVVSELLVNNISNKDLPEVIKPGATLKSAQALKSGDAIVLSYINEYGSTVKTDPISAH